MDYPKSVPGVGLVAGRFVDEDAATGRQGSLIPAVWGNAVTDELLNLLLAAGIDPDESKSDQVAEAVIKLMDERRQAFAQVTGTVSLAVTLGVCSLADGGAAAVVTLPSVQGQGNSADLFLFSAHSNLFAVKVKAAAGQTIKGTAALMGASTTELSMPLAGDWVRLRSNEAGGGWLVVGCYAVGERNRVAALEAVPKPVGVGQTWQNVTASRAFNVTYTNTTGRTIFVQVSQQSSTTYFNGVVDGVAIMSVREDSTSDNPVGFLVPPGSTYRVDTTSGSLLTWFELR